MQLNTQNAHGAIDEIVLEQGIGFKDPLFAIRRIVNTAITFSKLVIGFTRYDHVAIGKILFFFNKSTGCKSKLYCNITYSSKF